MNKTFKFSFIDTKSQEVVKGEGELVSSVFKKSPYRDHPGKHRFCTIRLADGSRVQTWEWNTMQNN